MQKHDTRDTDDGCCGQFNYTTMCRHCPYITRNNKYGFAIVVLYVVIWFLLFTWLYLQ